MSEKQLEKSEMSTLVFASTTMKNVLAPRAEGHNIQDRIRVAARKLGWSYSRAKDVWYADPRVSIDGEELLRVEETSGVTYGRAELRSINDIIRRAEALLANQDEDFHRPVLDAFRALLSALGRT